MYEDPSRPQSSDSPIAEFAGNRPAETPMFECEEGVRKDAVKLLWCRKWNLTWQIGTFWRQKLWEAKG